MRLGNAGFSHTPAGRGFLAQQHALFLKDGGRFDADYAALMLLYGTDGDIVETSAAQQQHIHRMSDDALIVRHAPWYYCLSAFTAPLTPNRFGQDRQNFFSLYHDAVGLICGGGNTKLQPLWSSFSVGDTALMYHVPGDEDPDFSARHGLRHVPDRAELGDGALHLHYGTVECQIILPFGIPINRFISNQTLPNHGSILRYGTLIGNTSTCTVHVPVHF